MGSTVNGKKLIRKRFFLPAMLAALLFASCGIYGQEDEYLKIDRVKDGMTYGLVQHIYLAYLSLLPGLTELQKAKILTWLEEARDSAMDGGSSEEKQSCFRKYRGKINNYLPAEGYDLKEAEKNRR
jgi:hypothetical protein